METQTAGMGVAGFLAGVAVTLVYVSFMRPATVVTPTAPSATTSVSAPAVLPLTVGPPVALPAAAESSKAALAPTLATKSATTPATTPATTRIPQSATKPTPRESVSNVDGAGAMQLIIPVQGIRASQLQDTYSDARGSGRRHDAIDIMAPHNTPVLAAAPAVVVKRDNGARGGIALYALAADRSTIYYYAHLDRYAPGVVEGSTLRAGDVLGYVGDTGNAGAGNYHLHFEITTTKDPKRYWGGVSHNPFPLLRTGITVK